MYGGGSLTDVLRERFGVGAARIVGALAGPRWQEAMIVSCSPATIEGTPPEPTESESTLPPAVPGRAGRVRHCASFVEASTSVVPPDVVVVEALELRSAVDAGPELTGLVRALAIGARIVLVVHRGWLGSTGAQSTRSALRDIADLEVVVSLPRSSLTRWPTSDPVTVDLAVISLRRDGGERRRELSLLAGLPTSPKSAGPAFDRLLGALESLPYGEEVRLAAGFLKHLGEDDSTWDPGWHEPERALIRNSLDLIEGAGHAHELGHVAEILRGRRPAREASSERVRVLQARDVSTELPELEDLELFPTDGRLHALASLRPGDIVGSISGPAGRWALVPPNYEDVYAGDHTVIVRPRAGSGFGALYLLTWLRSSTARMLFQTSGTVIQRLDLRAFARMPVPVPESPHLDEELERVDRTVGALRDRLDALRVAQTELFRSLQPTTIRRDVAELASSAAATLAGLGRHDDLLTRVQDLYPYPIARSVRALKLARDARAAYEELLNTYEVLLVFLGLVGAAWARRAGVLTPESVTWVRSMYEGGASLGRHLGALRSTTQAAHDADDQMGGLAVAMAARGRGSLHDALEKLLAERNTTHGGRPRTETEFADRVEMTQPLLEVALESTGFLAHTELLWVVQSRPIDTGGEPNFELTVERAIGDHPDWDLEIRSSGVVAFDHRFYLTGVSELLPMHPFLIARRCDECQQRHVYYPDKIKPNAVNLISVDRGHPRRETDSSTVLALREALPKPEAD